MCIYINLLYIDTSTSIAAAHAGPANEIAIVHVHKILKTAAGHGPR
jgi:hypothetical protein